MNFCHSVRIREPSIHDIGNADIAESRGYHRDAKPRSCKSDEGGYLLYLLHNSRRESTCGKQRRHLLINCDPRLPGVRDKMLVAQVREPDTRPFVEGMPAIHRDHEGIVQQLDEGNTRDFSFWRISQDPNIDLTLLQSSNL